MPFKQFINVLKMMSWHLEDFDRFVDNLSVKFRHTSNTVLYEHYTKCIYIYNIPQIYTTPTFCPHVVHRDTTFIYGAMFYDLKKLKWNCLTVMIIITCGGKGKLSSLRTPSQL